jgi:hypothetical protein
MKPPSTASMRISDRLAVFRESLLDIGRWKGYPAHIARKLNRGMRSRMALAMGAVAVYFLFVAGFQHFAGAADADFGGYSDEPSHFLSGLLIRDYCLSWFSTTPVAFAIDYYTHFPFFAVGYWPPFFYVLEAGWMAMFGADRAIVLLLPALIAALLSGTIFCLLRERLGIPGAFLVGGLLLLTPAVVWSNRLIMVDTTFGLLSLWAGLAFARWLDTGSLQAALLTGLFISLSLLTKINSIYLLLLLPLVFLLTGRWSRLPGRTFWVIPACVAFFWGPWIFQTRKLLDAGKVWSLARVNTAQIAIGINRALLDNLGWLLVLVLLGAAVILRHERRNSSLLVCVLLPPCYLAFLLAARVEIESRFLVPILAPSIVLAGMALAAISGRLASARMPAHWIAAGLAGVMLIAFSATFPAEFRKQPRGRIRAVVDYIRLRGGPQDASILVPHDAEGPFIAEFATQKSFPLRFIVRPTKLLAITDWNGGVYKARYQTPEEILSLFDRLPLHYTVVTSQSDQSRPDIELLKSTLDSHPERWRPLPKPPGQWLVYERIDGRKASQAQINTILHQYLLHQIKGS